MFEVKAWSKRFSMTLIEYAYNLKYQNIRIDPSPTNIIMEKVILAAGFTYRGMIDFVYTHGERKAYQL